MTNIREQAEKAARERIKTVGCGQHLLDNTVKIAIADGYVLGYEAAKKEAAAYIDRLERAIRVYIEKHEIALQRAEATEDALGKKIN